VSNWRENAKLALMFPAVIAWALAAPITFILNVVHTWQGHAPVWLKLLMNITLDAFLAGIWPITWMLWFIFRYNGQSTPLDLIM